MKSDDILKSIYFDMDGTLDNLYAVEDWALRLDSGDFSPYELAPPLLDLNKLSSILNKLKEKGYKLGIITWGSKISSEEAIEKVKSVKKKWLSKNLKDVEFDEFVILDYSCNKASSVKYPFGILFDDNWSIRKFWPGKSYPPEQIFTVLNDLLKESECE